MRNNFSNCMAAAFAATIILTSCATSKKAAGGVQNSTVQQTVSSNAGTAKMDFLRKVSDNEIYSSCITSKLKFTLNTGSKDVSVAGSLRMKKDDVIRIQLTPFGLMEAGRLEFTKDYVLIIDRINKRYVKEDYTNVDFLQRNGLDFYALQALFWNQLYMPGADKVSDSALKKYTVDFKDGGTGTLISYIRDNMSYVWTAENQSGRITKADITYSSKANGTTRLVCAYGAFKPLQSKQFPTEITMNMSSDAVKQGRTVTVSLDLDTPDTQTNWETRSEVSSKYRKVTVQEVMQLLTKM